MGQSDDLTAMRTAPLLILLPVVLISTVECESCLEISTTRQAANKKCQFTAAASRMAQSAQDRSRNRIERGVSKELGEGADPQITNIIARLVQREVAAQCV